MATSKSIGTRLIIIVFFGIFVLFGGAALYIAGEGAYYGYQSRSWPSTRGLIEESTIKTRVKKKGRKKRSLVINYRYKVDGMTYRNGKAQYLDNMFYSKTMKQRIVSRYQAGSQAPIHYNPANPAQAVLIPGFPIWSFFGGLIVGILFSGIGLFGLSRLFK